MVQQQPIQKSKLSEVEVRGCSRLISLLAQDTDANIPLLNHIDVVTSISNAQHRLPKCLFVVSRNESLLSRSTPTENERSTIVDDT